MMVRVESWVTHYVDEGPHKDRNTRVCVCVYAGLVGK